MIYYTKNQHEKESAMKEAFSRPRGRPHKTDVVREKSRRIQVRLNTRQYKFIQARIAAGDSNTASEVCKKSLAILEIVLSKQIRLVDPSGKEPDEILRILPSF